MCRWRQDMALYPVTENKPIRKKSFKTIANAHIQAVYTLLLASSCHFPSILYPLLHSYLLKRILILTRSSETFSEHKRQCYSPEPSPASHLYAFSELPTISALKQILQVQYNLMGLKSMFLFIVLKCWQVSTSLLLMSRSYFELGMVEPSYYSICGRFVFNCWASAAEEVCSPFKQLSKEWADGVKYNSTKKPNKKPFPGLLFSFLK